MRRVCIVTIVSRIHPVFIQEEAMPQVGTEPSLGQKFATRKNIYVKFDDLPLWDKAQRYARLEGGDSLSAVIGRSLKQYVAEREVAEQGMERIVVHVLGVPKAFVGKWLVSPQEMIKPGEDNSIVVAVATTKRGQFAAFWVHMTRPDIGGLEVYPTLEALKYSLQNEHDLIDSDYMALIRSRLDSEYVQELDV